eukprot:g22497.t1
MVRYCTFASCRGRCHGAVGVRGEGVRAVVFGVKEEWTRGIPEGIVLAEGRQEKEGEYVSGGGTSLKVVEMVSDALLDVDAGGMV